MKLHLQLLSAVISWSCTYNANCCHFVKLHLQCIPRFIIMTNLLHCFISNYLVRCSLSYFLNPKSLPWTSLH
jgi:hypothetical protein